MEEIQEDKTENIDDNYSQEKLAFFEKYFREISNDEIHRMERIENKSARLLSAISIIIVVLGWQIQNQSIVRYFNLFTWSVFVVMVVLLLITWFYFFKSLDFVETARLTVNKKLIYDIIKEDYEQKWFYKDAINSYEAHIEGNRDIVGKKTKKAKQASFFAKLTYICFCLLLFNIFTNIIEHKILTKRIIIMCDKEKKEPPPSPLKTEYVTNTVTGEKPQGKKE